MSNFLGAVHSVGMLFVTLCVMDSRRSAYSGEDAERPELHTHAEHGHDGVLARTYRSSRSSVGMLFVTLCVMDLRHSAHSGEDAERPERHTHAEHGHDGVLARTYRSSRSSVGMPFVTLRVMDSRRPAHSGEDAERPVRRDHDGVLRPRQRWLTPDAPASPGRLTWLGVCRECP